MPFEGLGGSKQVTPLLVVENLHKNQQGIFSRKCYKTKNLVNFD
jgi:hypothetical protein